MTGATKGPHQMHSSVPKFSVDYPKIKVRSENFPTLKGDQIVRLAGPERSERGEVHVVGLERHAIGRGKQVQHETPISQEQHSFGQSSIPNGNLVVTSGIAPPTVLLSDYDLLRKNFEELKQQNDELKINNEENIRRLQGVTALLCELLSDIHVPHIRQIDARGEHRRSPANPPMASRQGIRIITPGLNSQNSKVTDSRRKYGKRTRKTLMYKETTKNAYSRVPYDPSFCQNEVEQETLSASDIKCLIEEVLE